MWVQERESQHSTISCPALASRITEEDNRILEGPCEVDHKWCLRGRGREGSCEPKAMDLFLQKRIQEPTIVPKRGKISLKELAGPEFELSNRQVMS